MKWKIAQSNMLYLIVTLNFVMCNLEGKWKLKWKWKWKKTNVILKIIRFAKNNQNVMILLLCIWKEKKLV
jgi:glycopeptide antibiotics resistance protein